jgi:hypothetical protein
VITMQWTRQGLTTVAYSAILQSLLTEPTARFLELLFFSKPKILKLTHVYSVHT